MRWKEKEGDDWLIEFNGFFLLFFFSFFSLFSLSR